MLNYDLPADLLLRLEARHGQYVTHDMIANHPSVPLAYKLELQIVSMTGLQLVRFFEAVRATADEQAEVHRAVEQNPDARLSEVWSAIRGRCWVTDAVPWAKRVS